MRVSHPLGGGGAFKVRRCPVIVFWMCPELIALQKGGKKSLLLLLLLLLLIEKKPWSQQWLMDHLPFLQNWTRVKDNSLLLMIPCNGTTE